MLKVKRLNDLAKLPTIAHPDEDLGYDIYALGFNVIPPHDWLKISTGIAVEIDSHHTCLRMGGLLRDRSSMAHRGLTVVGGVIDSGYRGELAVTLMNNGKNPYIVHPGDKIAQLVPLPILADGVIEVEELNQSQRNEKGFGSSGR